MPPVVLPIAIPALAAALMLTLLRGRVAAVRAVSLASCLAQVAVALLAMRAIASGAPPALHQLGGWERTGPWALGIETGIDALSAIMLMGASVIGATAVAMLPGLLPEEERTHAHPLVQMLLLGVNLTFVTNDLFNLFVAFEIMLLASYGLLGMAVRGSRIRHAMTYLCVNLVASTLFLAGVGLVYAATGTVNMTDLGRRLADAGSPPPLAVVGCVFLFLAYGTKAAAVPLMGWMPEAYSALRGPLAGLFGGILTKVGVYAMLRVLWGVFGSGASHWALLGVLVLAAPTMILGGWGAVSRPTIRGILTLHIVAQIGYALFGIAVGSLDAIAATIFFLVHIMIVKAALFFIGAAMEHTTGAPDDDVGSFAGMAKSHPVLGAAYLVAALALIGFPPSTGYWGKVGLVRAGLDAGFVGLTVTALCCTLFTAFSLLRIWMKAFWIPPMDGVDQSQFRALPPLATGGLAGIIAVILFMGLWPSPFLRVSRLAAERLEAYHAPAQVASAPEARP